MGDRLHKLLGWVALVPLVYLALSGILAGLGEHMERIAYPQLFSVPPSSAPLLTRQEVQARYAGPDKNLTIARRHAAHETWLLGYQRNGHTMQAWVHPYSGELLGEMARSERLSWRVRSWHLLVADWLGMQALAALALLSGALLFRPYHRGRQYWHSHLLLASLPFALWELATGLGIDLGFTRLEPLHNPARLEWQLVMMLAMLTLALGLMFAPVARFFNKANP